MAKYRLSKAAEEDLINIAQYGDDQFGVAQSDMYREELKRRFSVLAESPELFASVDHIRVGYRRSVCGVHSIYYHIEGQDVEIVRVLGRQDPEKQL
jgi:toxin ParE1/3/4